MSRGLAIVLGTAVGGIAGGTFLDIGWAGALIGAVIGFLIIGSLMPSPEDRHLKP